LDEPTAGVDPEGRLGIREVIAELRGQGVAVLLTTHELAEAERLADRVVIIHHGRAAASGTLAELAAQSGAAATVRFGSASGLDVRSLSATVGVAVTEESAGRYRLDDAGSPQLTAALASWLAERDAPLSDLQTARSLEETYLSIVGSAAAAEPEPEPLGTGRRRGGRP
jgi:ABC-2 type transport system ATP-binding protein